MSGPVVKQKVAVAQQNTATINVIDAKVVIKVETDFNKPVINERVLLLRADGKVHQVHTDDDGVARFDNLPIPPGRFLYAVLPDVLESWYDPDARELHADDEDVLRVERAHNAGRCDEWGDVTRFREFHKDEVDKQEKISADDLDDDRLARLNRDIAMTDDYRKRDYTKYAVTTCPVATADAKCQKIIRINRLTQEQKFEHFREAIEENKAVYIAGRNGYDDDKRRWWLTRGCVCNQFANVFLAYWYNFNAACTPRASSTSFLRMVENDSSKEDGNQIYRYRGFSELLDSPAEAPAGTDTETYTTRRVIKDGTRGRFTYVRIDENFLVNSGLSFADTGRLKFSKEEFEQELGPYNVYSIASKTPLIFDHHGGIMLKSDKNMITTLSADGYKKNDGTYSKTEIKLKTPKNLKNYAKNRNLHLRIWPMLALRPGGYAPRGNQDGSYMAETDIEAMDTIDPAFRHSLSRFVRWAG
ncbi:MAG: hypothetical protein ACYTHJ_07285 [Planctomycetota bacterium]|jgi:hypothetical protein